jgi:hypothetical protein
MTRAPRSHREACTSHAHNPSQLTIRLPPAQPAQYSCVCNDCDRETWWQKLGFDKWRRGSASNTNDRNLASTPSTKPHTSHVDTIKKTMPRSVWSVVVVFFFPPYYNALAALNFRFITFDRWFSGCLYSNSSSSFGTLRNLLNYTISRQTRSSFPSYQKKSKYITM